MVAPTRTKKGAILEQLLTLGVVTVVERRQGKDEIHVGDQVYNSSSAALAFFFRFSA
jgi:hypothetical protein